MDVYVPCGTNPPATQVKAHESNDPANVHLRPILFIEIHDRVQPGISTVTLAIFSSTLYTVSMKERERV